MNLRTRSSYKIHTKEERKKPHSFVRILEKSGSSDAPKSESIFLQIVEHPDGSVTRPVVPLAPPVAAGSVAVISKDVSLDEAKGTWLRLYLPNRRPPPEEEEAAKLPILLYLHGGGFLLFSPDFVLYNAFCERAAAALPALVASLHYRLSPEHRLPLAYDDAADALRWLADPTSADPWVASQADLSRCFLAGSSSGGNIAYHAALRAGIPVKLAGVVMIQPYFGGEERTESEAGSGEDPVLPLRASDMMWRMALPVGASRDHEYCNPTTKPPVVEKGTAAPPLLPRCLVTGCKGDLLFDRQKVFAEMLEKAGAAEEVVVRFEDEGYHAIELFEPACAEKLLAEVREFVYGSGSN